jgi:hypothetical protein
MSSRLIRCLLSLHACYFSCFSDTHRDHALSASLQVVSPDDRSALLLAALGPTAPYETQLTALEALSDSTFA